ncbi:HAD-IIIC family phosphatase [Kitasatospora sp. NPDC059408]|uniref:HAD-IIIC family phosphatase n=1 Tax=Kitasatospora sp. NPDC059408 TaxID=3346823 RepID=UPI0036BF1012
MPIPESPVPGGPAAGLLALHRDGELAARYGLAQQLVSQLPPAELPRAGRLLARLDPAELLERHPGLTAVTVAVTGHGTPTGLVPALTAELARAGLVLRAQVSDFDSYVFDLSDPGSELYRSDPRLVLCLLDAAVVVDELPTPWDVTDLERVLEEKVRLIAGLAGHYAGTGTGTLVLNTLPLPATLPARLLDHLSRARLGRLWRQANARLLELAETHASVVVLDLDPLLAEGLPAEDTRLRAYTRTNLSPELLARYAREVGHLARHLTGRTRKCLVLDLDGTVWGGILGDDGPEGIEVGDGYRGEAFQAFQRSVKQLASQGVLLAAVSKNDPGPVAEALREHPGMVLREEDFVRVVANWRPKHENLRELARALNIGLDSLVFVDDSPYERELVRRELPEVAVVEVDGEPALHVERLLADGWFDVTRLTGEDRARPALYRQELDRQDFLDSFESLEGFLRELRVTVHLAPATDAEVARLSQITLRTNQFNLTTRRLQPADVTALRADPDAHVLAIRAADRFGDNGLVGAVFTRREGTALLIDNFLLSCRVFSRGIEQACLSAVLRAARASGAEEVVGEYRESPKNGKVRDFYPRHGFETAGQDGPATAFRHDLREIPAAPEHVSLIEPQEGILK